MANKLFSSIVLIIVFAAVSGAIAAAAAPGNLPQERLNEPSVVVSAATQEIQLDAGWNLVSSYVDPDDADLDAVFTEISADVVLVKDDIGGVYWPAYGVDQIGDWDVLDGYQIYMQNAAALSIGGTLVDPASSPIALDAGWNMIAYSRDLTQLASEALSSVSSQLLLVKDGDGQVYWPDLLVDQIGYMQPGSGYQVYLKAAGTLQYPVGAVTASPSLLISGAITQPGEKDRFEFSAQSGDAYILGLSSTSGSNYPTMELYDSSGMKLRYTSPSVNREIVHQFVESGDYTIVVRHSSDVDSFTYNLFLERINSPVGGVALSFSSLHSGSITQAAEMDAFTFTAVAGDAIIAKLSRTDGAAFPEMELYDVTGTQLSRIAPPENGEIVHHFAVSGDYTLLVSHYSGLDSLAYNLSLQRINNPVGAMPLSFSDLYSGSISQTAEMDAFTFTAVAGDAIIAGLSMMAGSFPEMELYDATGTKLASAKANPNGEFVYEFTASGEYTLLVSHYSGLNSIAYNLFLQRINNPVGGVALSFSSLHSGSITQAAEMDAFTFTVVAGDTIIAKLSRTDGAVFPEMELYDVTGTQLSWIAPPENGEIVHHFTVSGDYTLLVSPSSGLDSMAYNLSLQRINNPVGAMPLSFSDLYSGSISQTAEMDAFTFTAVAGDAIIAGLSMTAGSFPEMELYDATGTKLANANANPNGEFVYEFTASGEYTLLISHYSGLDSITYNLFLQRFNDPVGAVEIAYSENHAGAVVEPAEMDAFTFNAQAGDAIIVGATKTSGPDWIDLRVYDSAGNTLGHIAPTDHGEITYNITESAVYTILVSHSLGLEAFTYNLFLQRFNDPVGAAAIAYSDKLSGSIVEPAELDAFTFSAQAGDAIIANGTRTFGSSWLLLRLYDSFGNMLAAIGPPTNGQITHNITETAEYTILVSHSTGEAALGYNLFLQRFNDPAGAVGMSYSDTQAGDIMEPAEMDAFIFTAEAGDAVTAGLTNISGLNFAAIDVYDWSGNWLAGGSTTSHVDINFDIAETADYTILVSSSSGYSAFDYELSLDLDT